MARVSLKDVQVSRVFWDNKAAEVVESFNTKDGPATKKYTLWFNEPTDLTEGSIIDADGLLKAEVREFQSPQSGETVRYAQISINNPNIKVTSSAPSKVGHAAVNQVWPEVSGPGTPQLGDGAPF